VAGVLYLAPPEVEHALQRAIDSVRASEQIVVVPLDALPCSVEAPKGPPERIVSGEA
jgi:hypothetical protein